MFAGSGNQGDRDGEPLESEFYAPVGIAIDCKTNDCFITDNKNHRIRVIHCK